MICNITELNIHRNQANYRFFKKTFINIIKKGNLKKMINYILAELNKKDIKINAFKSNSIEN